MDAYCKLEHFGIEIYTAIDVYSRYIIWFYVGLSSRTAISVASQYLATLREGHVIPLFLRTDRGTETILAADSHYIISSTLREREDGEPLQFSDCFKYSTSKENVRIESWWRQQSKTSINQWRDCFISLANKGEFNRDSLGNRIAFKAIYMPIIRRALDTFVNLWNYHEIRKEPKRPYLVHGIPYMLYNTPQLSSGEHCGCFAPEEVVEDMQSKLPEFGSFSTRRHTRNC